MNLFNLLKSLRIEKSNNTSLDLLMDDFEILLKGKSHKYLKREGTKGNYKYTYEEGESKEASVDQLNSLASALHSVRIKAGKEREDVVSKILDKSGEYTKVQREFKIKIGMATRKHHSVDIYAETDDKIYLFNLKSGGHSNTEPIEGMIDTFLNARDKLQETTDKKVEYAILRFDLNKQLERGRLTQVTQQFKDAGIDSLDLNDFVGQDIGVLTERSLRDKFIENIKNKMSQEDLLDTVNFLMGGLKKSITSSKEEIKEQFIAISQITGLGMDEVIQAFKAAVKIILK